MTTNKPEVKRYDCTSGGAQHCYGCYTMEEGELGDYVEWEAYEALQAECERLRKDADGYRLLDHAAGVLPEGWLIRIDIEREAGWVDLHRPGGGRVAFDFQGSLAEQIAEAIDCAMGGEHA